MDDKDIFWLGLFFTFSAIVFVCYAAVLIGGRFKIVEKVSKMANYYVARSHIWKQVAKHYRKLFYEEFNSGHYMKLQWSKTHADADRRLELLKRSKPWLESYLEYLDTDIPLIDINSELAKLIDELAEELER